MMITAIILAAGRSMRMGSPKMLLRWGNVTVMEHVVSVFANAGIEDILVVTGGARAQVDDVILECRKKYPVRSVYNENYLSGDMLSSIQCGLRSLTPLPLSREERGVRATLIGLGDQPQVEARSVRLLCESFLRTKSPLVVPSFQMRRGHPWLVARALWNELIEMNQPQTPRDFLNAHAQDIYYVGMDTPTVLADLDTPEDYRTSLKDS